MTLAKTMAAPGEAAGVTKAKLTAKTRVTNRAWMLTPKLMPTDKRMGKKEMPTTILLAILVKMVGMRRKSKMKRTVGLPAKIGDSALTIDCEIPVSALVKMVVKGRIKANMT